MLKRHDELAGRHCTDSIRNYCLHHKLDRPHIRWGKVILVIFVFEALLGLCIAHLGLSASSSFFLADIIHFATLCVCGKRVLRLIVHIYQRYAPDSIRRQCSCQPTCSEYALLALDKYNYVKAMYLIFRRVTHTCQQTGYKLDYP